MSFNTSLISNNLIKDYLLRKTSSGSFGNNVVERLFVSCYFLLWLYLFLPFRIFNFPFVFGQIEEWAMSAVLLTSMSILLFAGFFRKKHFIFRMNYCDSLLLLYLIYMLFRIYEDPAGQEYILTLYTLTMLYIVTRISGGFHIRLLIWILVISVLFQVCDAFYRYDYTWSHIPVIVGIYHNTGIWGGFTGIVSVVMYGLLLYSGRKKILLSVLLLFLLVLLVYSQSRAAWISAFAGIVFLSCLLLVNKYDSRLKKPAIISVLLSIPLLLFTCKALYQMKPVSADGRFYIWQISSRMLSENPLSGIGIGKFKSQYMSYQAEYLSQNPGSPFARIADETDVPFSEPLKIAVEQGVVGLTIFLAILIAVLIPVIKKKHIKSKERQTCVNEVWEQYVYAAVMISLLIFSCFSYPFLYIQFHFLSIACLAVLARSQSGVRVIAGRNKTWLLSLIPCVLVGCYISFTGMTYSVCMKKMHDYVTHFDAGKPESILPVFAELEPSLNTNPNYLVSYAKFLSLNKEYGRAVEKLTESLSYQSSYYTYVELGRNYEQAGDTELAISCWQLASDMIPGRFEPLYLQIGSYHHTGRYNRADSLTVLFLQKKRKVDNIQIDRMMKNVREWEKERKR